MTFGSVDRADETTLTMTADERALDTNLPSRAGALRQARRHQRELRRQCDRRRLEEALGWNADLIKRLRT